MTRYQRGSDDWLPASEAAALTGEPVRLWERRAARESEEAERQERRSRAIRARAPGGVDQSVWWVKRCLATALLSGRVQNRLARQALLARYPVRSVERAYRKARLVRAWRRLCDTERAASVSKRDLADRIVAKARAAYGEGFRISGRSLYGWWGVYAAKLHDGRHAALEALIEYKSLRRPSGVGMRWLPVERDPRAVGHFLKLRRSGLKLSLRSCHRVTRAKADRKGWRWAGSDHATRRWWRVYRTQRPQGA